MAPPTALEVVEYTDPHCPWAWGSAPTLQRLRELLSPRVRWRRVYGILFDTTDDAAPDPVAETAWYHRHLADISAHTGAPYPRTLERVALTSWPASQVCHAARAQGAQLEERVLRRLRERLFLDGEPPDTMPRALEVAAGVPGVDLPRLAEAAVSPAVLAAVADDRRETRAPVPEVLEVRHDGPHGGQAKPVDGGVRYALPTLLFVGADGYRVVPGWRPLSEYTAALAEVDGHRHWTYSDGN